jgi:hypothetical protein
MGQFVETTSISWPVKVELPIAGSATKKRIEKFNVTFRVRDRDERIDQLKKIPDLKNASQEEIMEYELQAAESMIEDMEGWDIENLEFTPDNVAKVMNSPYYFRAIMKANAEAQNGGAVKN